MRIPMNRTLLSAAVATIALAGTLVAGAPALADSTPKPLATAKKVVTARIDKRLAALERFDATLGQAHQVQAGHRATLDKLIDDQTAGLTALRAKVAGETTAEAVKADAKSMVNDFRVFILTGPKVRLTAAIDTELVAAAKLDQRASVDDAKIDAVRTELSGKVDALLAIHPGPDGDAIRAAVTSVRAAAKDARAHAAEVAAADKPAGSASGAACRPRQADRPVGRVAYATRPLRISRGRCGGVGRLFRPPPARSLPPSG